jgi:very-short-patch-repair endonuclease
MRQQRDPGQITRAKEMRREMSPPERALWRILRGHRLEGWKFTRQVPVGPFYIDFACRRERLGLELDGETHVGREVYDARRTRYLETDGWHIIRFTNREIGANPEGVSLHILQALRDRSSPRRGEDT